MKILIIGADGQLGTDLCRVIPNEEQIPLTIKDLDITDREKTLKLLRKHGPQVVINTAAYHRVDDCEEHVTEAFAVNAAGVKHAAAACRDIGAALVHISTDYVFDGEKKTLEKGKEPYFETDCPNPQSVYGISKLAGEFCVRYLLEKYFIVRSSGLYGVTGCMGKGGGNFVENMVKREEAIVVHDEILSPTYTYDLANKIYQLLKTGDYGLYHIVNKGKCSWYEFACEIFSLLGRDTNKITPVATKDYVTAAKRPKYSVLRNANLEKIGLNDMRPWQDALRAYLIEKGHIKS